MITCSSLEVIGLKIKVGCLNFGYSARPMYLCDVCGWHALNKDNLLTYLLTLSVCLSATAYKNYP